MKTRYSLFNDTERLFHTLHGIYPDELYVQLLEQGWPRSIHSIIQEEMSRLYKLTIQPDGFTYTPHYPFTT